MTKFKTIFLHIGLHKTGSTAIQHTLHNYRDELATSHKLLYPAVSRNHSMPLVAMFHDQPHTYRMNIRAGIHTADAASVAADQHRARFEQEMSGSSCEQVLLSGEDVSDLTASALQRLQQWLAQWADNITVIAMVRNPVSWAVSAAQGNIRGGKTYAQVNKQLMLLRLSDRLQKFADIFGRDNMKVFTLEEAQQFPAGLAACLLDKVGMPGMQFPNQANFNQNPGMSLEAAQLISALNKRRPLFVEGKLNPRRFDGDVIPIVRKIKGQPFRLQGDAMQRIQESAEADRAWLKENFALDLAVEVKQESAAAATEPTDFSADAIENIALTLHAANIAEYLSKSDK